MRLIALSLTLLIATPAGAAAPWILTPQGLGPVRLGMTPEQVAQVAGKPVNLDESGSDNPKDCAVVEMPGHDGVDLLFESARLTAIWLYKPARYKTARKIGVGAKDSAVAAAYPQAIKGPADYDDAPAANFLVWEKKDVLGLLFRTDETRKVVSIAAGTDSIEYMEGCS